MSPEVSLRWARTLIDELHATIGQFSLVFSLAPDAFAWTDEDGRIAWCNRAFERFVGRERLALLDTPLTDHLVLERDGVPVVGEEHPARRILTGPDTLAGTYETLEDRVVEVHARRGLIAKPVAVIVVRDVTERARAETETMLLNAQLAAANAELEAFSYSVSHDLRTPLRAIDGFGQVLLEDYGRVLDAEGRDCLMRLRNATQSMGRLIDDLLRLSRVTRAELAWTEVDLTAMCREIVEELAANAPQRRVDFVIANGLVARGDEQLLRQVFRNLLDNAWKFTGRVGQPRIEVGRTDDDVFYVRDNGAGFDMERADKLFGAFQRLHRAEEFPGTGIGLALVRRIVHRHGGRVWAESVVGRGATFYLTLPDENGSAR